MRVLVVEDDAHLRAGLERDLTRAGYAIDLAEDGVTGERLGRTETYQLVVLDLGLPHLSGLDVLRAWRGAGNTVPVLILTAQDTWHQRVDGFNAGADDYLAKPFHTEELLARMAAIIKRSHGVVPQAAVDELKEHNQRLQAEIEARQREIHDTQHFSMDALAELAKLRDNETGNHIRRTQAYVRTLATWLRQNTPLQTALDEAAVSLITQSAPLHDIGKVAIPDSILLKPGKLTPEEWEIMKTHSARGAEALELVEQRHPESVGHLVYAKQIARHHHEKWDGSGYPDGLAGEAIPLSARLMALADVFDALLSKRVYKASWSTDEVFQYILDARGSHFDPLVVDACLACRDDFLATAARYAD